MSVNARLRTGNAKCPELDCSGELWHQLGTHYVCSFCGHLQRQTDARVREFYSRATEVGQ